MLQFTSKELIGRASSATYLLSKYLEFVIICYKLAKQKTIEDTGAPPVLEDIITSQIQLSLPCKLFLWL
jgi:hypothetical protein